MKSFLSKLLSLFCSLMFPISKVLYFSSKKPPVNVEKIFIRKYYHLMPKFAAFSRKNPCIFAKNPNFESFAVSYYFSSILRQICYKLVIRIFQGQKWTLGSSRTLSIGKSGLKNTSNLSVLSGQYSFRVINLGGK